MNITTPALLIIVNAEMDLKVSYQDVSGHSHSITKPKVNLIDTHYTLNKFFIHNFFSQNLGMEGLQ